MAYNYTYNTEKGLFIKREALRLMFATDNATNVYNNNAELVEQGVADYNDKMDGAIYRAIIRICQAKKAGLKKITIPSEKFEELKDGLDLTAMDDSAEIMQINKISVKISNRPLMPYNSFYTIDYKTLVIEDDLPENASLTVWYYPSYVDLDSLRDDVIAIIPLYVKSELYEEDEATLAVKARNMFESQLQLIELEPQTIQTHSVNVLGGFC